MSLPTTFANSVYERHYQALKPEAAVTGSDIADPEVFAENCAALLNHNTGMVAQKVTGSAKFHFHNIDNLAYERENLYLQVVKVSGTQVNIKVKFSLDGINYDTLPTPIDTNVTSNTMIIIGFIEKGMHYLIEATASAPSDTYFVNLL